MEDDVDSFRRAQQTVAIPDISDKETHITPPPELLALVELLRLIATEDPDDGSFCFEELLDQAGADRARPTRDEHVSALH
jgi:hypothetical protein